MDANPEDPELISFPFDAPFTCDLHSVHPASCAIPDVCLPLTEPLAPLLSSITHGDPESGLLKDAEGRVRVLRGINVCYKVIPHLPLLDVYHPSLSVARSELRLFARLGFNAVRLGVPWAAVQPRKPNGLDDDGFDLDYLRAVRTFVDDAASEGLYVLISAHQDLYAATFVGNGMPNWSITSSWYTLSFPRPVRMQKATYDPNDPDGLPDLDSIGMNDASHDDWGYFYVSDAVARAFWGFYNNEDGIRDAFCASWAKVASTLRGASNICGYEILNEPFLAARTGAGASQAFFTNSAYDATERDHLRPLNDAVHAAIRQYDSDAVIMFEPVTGNAGGNGFVHRGGDLLAAEGDKAIFAYHLYGVNAVNKAMKSMRGQIETRFKQAGRLGVGLAVTEWDIECKPRRIPEMHHTLALLDEHALSWFGWQYKEFVRVCGSPTYGSLIDPRSGHLRRSMATFYSRPWAEAIAGAFLKQHYDVETRKYTLRYRSTSMATTVIRVSEDEWAYGHGYEVFVTPENQVVATQRPPYRLEVAVREVAGIEVTVTVSPKTR